MLTVVLPLPDAMLSPNARPNRYVLARKKAKARSDGKIAALHAMILARMREPPRWSAATTECHFFFRARQRRDKDNLNASMKAAMDGITDAGVWVDDSVVTPLPPIIGYDKQDPRVEIHITEIVNAQLEG